jgi:hypothetical protein
VTPSDAGGSRDPAKQENALDPHNPGYRALMPPARREHSPLFLLPTPGGPLGQMLGKAVAKVGSKLVKPVSSLFRSARGGKPQRAAEIT